MSQSKNLFKIYVEDGALQDKALYIKKVLESCKTQAQLSVAMAWARTTFESWVLALASRLKRKERNLVLYIGASLTLELDEVYRGKLSEIN